MTLGFQVYPQRCLLSFVSIPFVKGSPDSPIAFLFCGPLRPPTHFMICWKDSKIFSIIFTVKIYYSSTVRIHSQINKGKKHIRQSLEKLCAGFLCSVPPVRVRTQPILPRAVGIHLHMCSVSAQGRLFVIRIFTWANYRSMYAHQNSRL